MGMRVLYLVRHGQYVMDESKPNYGSLTPLGRKQAVQIGKRLAHTPFAVIHHSDMLRAVETAEVMARQIERTRLQMAADLPNTAALSLRSSSKLREGIPSGPTHWGAVSAEEESQRARTQKRMDQAFAKLFRPCRAEQRLELVVAHGNLIRYLIRRAMNDSTENWWRMDIHQGSLSIVAILPPPRDAVLIRFNDVGHLPPHLQTLL
jgi:serine/threonine-protein phosphatase PGAM5